MLEPVSLQRYQNYNPYTNANNRSLSAQKAQQEDGAVMAPEDSNEIPVNQKGADNASNKADNNGKGKGNNAEGECQTCKNRTYQDGSDDPGVSFKTPTKISSDRAASAVRSHENEHVVREQAKAQREGRKVVSQSVTYHTGICSECGDVYVSGGTTRTVTKGVQEQEQVQQDPWQDTLEPTKGQYVDVLV